MTVADPVERGTERPRRSLVIAVLTFRRPQDLAAVLPELTLQAARVRSARLDPHVLVVDNDPAASARSIVEGFSDGGSSTVPVRYAHEPEPGIAAARNQALREAAQDDLLVFIDDDERPSEHWLRDLLTTMQDSGAAAVVGPVVSRFAVAPDSWIQAGRFFVRRRMPTGSRVDVAATNNLLLDLAVVRALGLTFDPGSGISGGEDTLFTRQLHAGGGALVWCDEAVVTDEVPAARTTRGWVVRRAFSSGNSWSLVAMTLAGGAPARARAKEFLRLQVNGSARLVGGSIRAAIGAVLRREAANARGVRTAARGAGMVLGALGYRYSEYRRS